MTLIHSRAEVHIDTAAYQHNIRQLISILTGSSELWAVVKADAYGHGAELLARQALEAGAKRLCVATLSEAKYLRHEVGISEPILIMGPLDEAGMASARELEVSFALVNAQMVMGLETLPISDKIARVHLKVDTGMGRWGVGYAEASELLHRVAKLENVELEGLMTHFATADEDDERWFETQLERFRAVVDIAREVQPTIIVHAANSAATLRFPASHFDAVRCGCATFGMDPMQESATKHKLIPVLSLHARVADIRVLQTGESTGYGRSFIAKAPVRIAKIPLGYADGLPRSIGNRGRVMIDDREYNIVGNVSMDHVSVEVDDTVNVNDVVTFIGSSKSHDVSVEQYAAWADTINYEITCRIASEPRIKRVFSSEAEQ